MFPRTNYCISSCSADFCLITYTLYKNTGAMANLLVFLKGGVHIFELFTYELFNCENVFFGGVGEVIS